MLEYYQRKFRYVLVDEYQDTNHLQYLLTALLAGGRKNLCVVGDDDQSIYRFRGANIENILSFEKQYPKARLIRLEQNYRSTQNILDAANAVIAQQPPAARARPSGPTTAAASRSTVHTAFNESDEANFVAGDILMGVHRGRQLPGPRRALPDERPVQRPGIRHEAQRHPLPHRGRHQVL